MACRADAASCSTSSLKMNCNPPSDGVLGNEEGFTIEPSTVKIDDGGSDLTDRFKYKVNALMGVFDPSSEEDDNEHAEGNILNAMLTFPVYYSFNVVGKTNSDNGANSKEVFIDAVKEIVQKHAMSEDVACAVTPRGQKFTKVTIEAQVESAARITSIYKELQALDQSVMIF